MARPKSVLLRMVVEDVIRVHNCQHNSRHRLQQGDKRLKVIDGLNKENFCVDCALKIIRRDILQLESLAKQLVDNTE